MNEERRRVILKMACAGLLSIFPKISLANWPSDAFKSISLAESLKALAPNKQKIKSDKVNLQAPAIAENGALVPISVSTNISSVERISILVANNPNPLAADFRLTNKCLPDVKIKVKMSETSPVLAAIETDSTVHTRTQEVKVTLGGCGG